MSTFNTAAGWVLAGGIVALGSSIVMGEVFHTERPETMGYVVEGVEAEGEEAGEVTFVDAMYDAENPVTAEMGEAVFRRCATCHTINQGGATGTGPNLYGIMGQEIAARPGFSYSGALSEVGGSWTFDNMFDWLASPRTFAPGTTMSFAGLSSPADRAALILYLNEQGSNMAMPEAPAEEPAEDGEGDTDNPEVMEELEDGTNPPGLAAPVEDAVENEGDGGGRVER